MNQIGPILDRCRLPSSGSRQDAKVDPGTLRRYILGFSWTLLGTVAAQASTYLSMVLMARILGLDAFGRLGTVQVTLAAMYGVSTLGTGITATRYIARYRAADPDRAGRIMGLCSLASLCSGTLSSLALLLCADAIASRMFHAGELATAIRITAPYCALMTTNAQQVGSLLGFEAYGRLLRAQMLQGITTLVLTAGLVSSLGLSGAVLSLPLSSAFAWLFMHLELKAECLRWRVKPTFENAWSERHVLMGFALPASLSGIIASAAIWGVQGVLVRTPGGMQEMGLWTAAAAMRSVVLLAPGVLNRVSSPILSSLHDHESGDAYGRALWSATAVSTAGAAAAGLILLMAGPVVLSLFGEGYRRAQPLLPLVVGSAVVEVYACSVCQAMVADGRMKFQILITTAWGSALGLVAFATIPSLLARGLALSYLASWAVAAASYTLLGRRLLLLRGSGPLSAARAHEVVASESI